MTTRNKVRLKSGHVIECTTATRDASGQVTEVQAVLITDTKSSNPGSDAVKVKGGITWIGGRHGYFVAYRVDHGVGKLVFNLAVGLKPESVSRLPAHPIFV